MKQEIKMIDNKEVDSLYNDIKLLVEESRNRVYKTVNTEMINLYWNIGKIIVVMQDGNKKAKYGDYLIKELSIRLTNKFGRGFSIPNLKRMRQFYNCFPIGSTLLNQLTWSHYLELIKIDDVNKREFYNLERKTHHLKVVGCKRPRNIYFTDNIISW